MITGIKIIETKRILDNSLFPDLIYGLLEFIFIQKISVQKKIKDIRTLMNSHLLLISY